MIAEVAQAHDGSLGCAHAYIDAAAEAGADAVKFQTHIASAESTLDEPWRVKFSRQDETRYDYWKRMEFSSAQWKELFLHCEDRNVEFISSPFSLEAVELLDDIGMRIWKIASGEIYNPMLIDAVLDTKKPVVYSTGMSNIEDLVPLITKTQDLGRDFAILQCTTAYPCPPKLWGLNIIDEIRDKFKCPTGFSDHSGNIFAGLAAATLGAEILELHITFSHQAFGPDVPASVTPDQLAQLVEGIRQINDAQRANPSKQTIADSTANLRNIFGRSLALREELPAGTEVELHHLVLKKPAGGFTYEEIGKVVGRSLKENKGVDRILREEDLT